MTKYKKLTRSSFVIVALCLALVGILAFGGTYAYFSAKAEKSGTITMGTLGLSEITLSLSTDNVVPGQDVLKAPVTFTSSATTNVPMIMLAKVEITSGDETAIKTDATVNAAWEGVEGHNGFYAYKGTNYKTAGTASESFTVVDTIYVDRTNGNAIQGKTLTVKVTVYAMQANYVGADNGDETTFDSAAAVYTAISTYINVGGDTTFA